MTEFDLLPVQEVYSQPTEITDYGLDYQPQPSVYQEYDRQYLVPSSLTFGQDENYLT
jgi:hypothetical protein